MQRFSLVAVFVVFLSLEACGAPPPMVVCAGPQAITCACVASCDFPLRETPVIEALPVGTMLALHCLPDCWGRSR